MSKRPNELSSYATHGLHLKAVGLLHSVSVQKEMGTESLNIKAL